jgi:hypothetical protein
VYSFESIILINSSATKEPEVSHGCYLANTTTYFLAVPFLILIMGFFIDEYPIIL